MFIPSNVDSEEDDIWSNSPVCTVSLFFTCSLVLDANQVDDCEHTMGRVHTCPCLVSIHLAASLCETFDVYSVPSNVFDRCIIKKWDMMTIIPLNC